MEANTCREAPPGARGRQGWEARATIACLPAVCATRASKHAHAPTRPRAHILTLTPLAPPPRPTPRRLGARLCKREAHAAAQRARVARDDAAAQRRAAELARARDSRQVQCPGHGRLRLQRAAALGAPRAARRQRAGLPALLQRGAARGARMGGVPSLARAPRACIPPAPRAQSTPPPFPPSPLPPPPPLHPRSWCTRWRAPSRRAPRASSR